MNTIKNVLLFILTLALIVNCSSKDEKTMFDSAEKKAAEKKFAEAISEFDLLNVDFPDGEYTRKGNFSAAKIYHSLLVPNLSKEESFKNAIKYYRLASKDFAKTKEAENALMMIGYIQANELNQIDSAKLSYELFMKKYSESELMNSVKLEYQNVGLTPEQILEKSLSQSK